MKLGAQRLYKAVAKGDAPTVMLYLTSPNRGEFHYQKVFESWIASGQNAAVLDALFQNEPNMVNWGGTRRSRRNRKTFKNDDYGFGSKVLSTLTISEEKPPTNKLVKVKELVKVIAKLSGGEQALNSSYLAQYMVNLITEHDAIEWPYSIASESRGLGVRLATHIYYKKGKQEEIIEWFHDHHGAITVADFGFSEFNSFLAHEQYPLLKKFIPDETKLRMFLAQKTYPYEDHAKDLQRKFRQYQELIKIAPWLEVK